MDPQQVKENSIYTSNVYFTRLHVRYNRSSFPQDLMFQVTPNTDNFQARYIVTHPAKGDLDCEAGKQYLKELKQRRTDEMEMLNYLTGKNYNDWDLANDEDAVNVPTEASYGTIAKTPVEGKDNTIAFAAIGVASVILLVGMNRRRT